jgi:nitrate/nitrite transporter NarK
MHGNGVALGIRTGATASIFALCASWIAGNIFASEELSASMIAIGIFLALNTLGLVLGMLAVKGSENRVNEYQQHTLHEVRTKLESFENSLHDTLGELRDVPDDRDRDKMN